MKVETKLKLAQEESKQFGQYAEYMLSEFPENESSDTARLLQAQRQCN